MQTPPPVPNATASRTRWWIHLLLITAYIVVAGLLGLQRRPGHIPALLHNARGLLLVCGIEILVFGSVFGLACWISKATRDDLLLRWRGMLKPVWLGIGYSVAVRIAIGVLVFAASLFLLATRVVTLDSLQKYTVTHKPDPTTVVDLSALSKDPEYYWLTITLASFVVAGLREELWRSAFLAGLRSLWPQIFSSRGGQVGAVFIAAVLFGSAHLSQGAMGAAVAGLIGVALGLIMVFHRSIWPAVIAHGCFDAATFAMLPWAMAHVK